MNDTTMANINSEASMAAVFGRLEQFQPAMSWNNYKERMEFYFEANGLKSEVQQKAIFLACVGETTYEVSRSLLTPLGPKDVTFQEILEKLDGHFHPKPNEIVQRFAFHKRCQKPGETVADFVKDLRKLSEHCNFVELNNMLSDQIVCGISDETLQKRLFSDTKLDFQRAYELALAHETASKNVLNVRGTDATAYASGNDILSIATYGQRSKTFGKCFRCHGFHKHEKWQKLRLLPKEGSCKQSLFQKKIHGRKTKNNEQWS